MTVQLTQFTLEGPACVRLNGEQVVIAPSDDGLAKYSIRIINDDGTLRPLTRDEELALAAAPGTKAEWDAAAKRVIMPGRWSAFSLGPATLGAGRD